MRYDMIIIGSGPAGLAAAYAAGAAGKKVAVLEKMSSPGMKLLASGGSRCNVSNNLPLEKFAERFGNNWRFLLPALSQFHGETLLEFFDVNGVGLTLTDGFHYFPASGKARDVRDMFISEISRFGGKIFCNEKVINLQPGKPWLVKTENNIYRADCVISASGGRGYPQLGGSMAGYDILSAIGHTVTGLYPGMTGVITADRSVGECAGISLPDCEVRLDVKNFRNISARGELLFTHRGFSAFAILDLASVVAKLLDKNPVVPVKIDFLPGISREEVAEKFSFWRKKGGTARVSTLLSEFFPKRLALMFTGGNDPVISRWQSEHSNALLQKLKGGIYDLCGVEGWDKAMVTAGGVSLKEIFPDTLESKLFPGLFFAGEVIDAAGPCGGFNITWALASGMLAGSAAASAAASADK